MHKKLRCNTLCNYKLKPKKKKGEVIQTDRTKGGKKRKEKNKKALQT